MDNRHHPARLTALTGSALALAFALAACGSGDGPESVVEGFLDSGIEDYANGMAARDLDRVVGAAEEYFCAEDVERLQGISDQIAEMSEEERDATLRGVEEYAVPDDYGFEIGESSEDGDTATVNITITGEGRTSDQVIDLVREEDEWRICGFGV